MRWLPYIIRMVYKDKFIDPEQINDIIYMIQKMAFDQGFTAALVGGVAMQVYGSPRLTQDVDFAVSHEPDDDQSLTKIRKISFGGESYRAKNGGKVDLIARSDEYRDLYEDALANSQQTSDEINIVTPEHLAAMKLAAAREKDILDLKWLIRQPKLLDLFKTRGIVYRFMGRYAQDRFNDIADMAMMEKEMHRKRGRDPEEE